MLPRQQLDFKVESKKFWERGFYFIVYAKLMYILATG